MGKYKEFGLWHRQATKPADLGSIAKPLASPQIQINKNVSIKL